MVFSRGLVISLGVSALSCTLLFLYFRNKITNIESKVNIMMDIIQTHDTSTHYIPTPNNQRVNEAHNVEHQNTIVENVNKYESSYIHS